MHTNKVKYSIPHNTITSAFALTSVLPGPTLQPGPEVINFFMPNLNEHEIYHAHKC